MNEPLSAYLAELDWELRRLPQRLREAELTEIHHHLSALAADYGAEGSNPELALRHALRQFGAAQPLGQALLRSWRLRNLRLLLQQVLIYICCTMVVFSFLLMTMDQPTDIAATLGAKCAWAALLPLPNLLLFWVRRRQLS